MSKLWNMILAMWCAMAVVSNVHSGWYYCAAFNAVAAVWCLIDYAKSE